MPVTAVKMSAGAESVEYWPLGVTLGVARLPDTILIRWVFNQTVVQNSIPNLGVTLCQEDTELCVNDITKIGRCRILKIGLDAQTEGQAGSPGYTLNEETYHIVILHPTLTPIL